MRVRACVRAWPPHSSMDATFFDYWAAKLEWEDVDMVEMVAADIAKQM